jgi:hypothetical protein
MTDKTLSDLLKYPWMRSCIPRIDALAAFVPDGSEHEAVIVETQDRIGQSRWYPVEGGHRVLMPYDGKEYDASRFTIEAGAWDHEHCKVCGDHIPAMTLCYVTDPGQLYILLCAKCYDRYMLLKQHKQWWRFW